MTLTAANSFRGHWKGWTLKIETFLRPEMAMSKPRVPFGLQKNPLLGPLERGGPQIETFLVPPLPMAWVIDLPPSKSLSPSAIFKTGTLVILCTWVCCSCILCSMLCTGSYIQGTILPMVLPPPPSPSLPLHEKVNSLHPSALTLCSEQFRKNSNMKSTYYVRYDAPTVHNNSVRPNVSKWSYLFRIPIMALAVTFFHG